MILIFFLYLKLSIIQFGVADLGYNCERDRYRDDFREPIILLESDNDISRRLNKKFIEKCQDFYQINRHGDPPIDGYVINLYVTDYQENKDYESNDYNLLEYLEYVGDINHVTECTATNQTAPKFKCDNKVKLVSKSISDINSGDLYNFVEQMQIIDDEIHTRQSCFNVQNTEDLKTVLLCLDEPSDYINVNIEPLKLRITTLENCKNYIEKFKNNFLAVLAPRPFEMDYQYLTPVVFYETPFLFSENKTYFPNSITLQPWQLLKYAFFNLIRKLDVRRFAILSDDSEHSIAFEEELTTLFSKERMVYTVVRCEESKCDDMTKLLNQYLYKTQPWVVIGNVDEKNAKELIRNSHPRITWLLRDMIGTNYQFISENQKIISFTLGPAVSNSKDCNLDVKVLDGLSSIALAYKKITEADFLTLDKLKFYKKFAYLMESTRKPECTAHVHKLKKEQSFEVSSMHVDISGAEEISFKHPFDGKKPNDGLFCIISGYDYFKPCEESLLLILMFVIMMFTITILLMTCYFHKTSPFHDIRYINF